MGRSGREAERQRDVGTEGMISLRLSVPGLMKSSLKRGGFEVSRKWAPPLDLLRGLPCGSRS